MLKVANCPKCGKVFSINLRNMCDQCIAEYNEAVNRCHDYLRDHRKATNAELSEATGVSGKQIVQFILESRLPTASYPNLTYPCKSCAEPIRQGQLCYPCKVRIVDEWNRLREKEELARGTGFQMNESRFRR